MLDPNAIPDVSIDETLARFIVFQSHIRADQTIRPDAFMPHPYLDLSVTRLISINDNELLYLGEQIAAGQGKSLCGRANIPVEICLKQSLTVNADAIPENPNHALIVGWPQGKPLQKLKHLF